jgi:hypothetical protein
MGKLQRSDSARNLHGHKPHRKHHNDNVFYNAVSHGKDEVKGFHLFSTKNKKPKSKKVDWERSLGKYNPSLDYTHFKKVYNRKLLEARAKRNLKAQAELRNAWRAMRKNITQSKRGMHSAVSASNASTGLHRYYHEKAQLKRQLHKNLAKHPVQMHTTGFIRKKDVKTHDPEGRKGRHHAVQQYRANKAALKTKYTKGFQKRNDIMKKFKHGELHTGRVALPPASVSKKSLKSIVSKLYKTVNQSVIKSQRQSLCKFLQSSFVKNIDKILKMALAGASAQKKLGLAGFALGGAAVAGACAVVPIVPLFAVFGASYVVGSAGALTAQRHSEKMVPIIKTLAKASSFPLSVVTHTSVVQPVTAALTWAVMKIPKVPCVSNATMIVIEASLKLVFKYYVTDINLEMIVLVKVLKRHAGTIKRVLEGHDVSLEHLFVDCVDVIPNNQIQAAHAALQKKLIM